MLPLISRSVLLGVTRQYCRYCQYCLKKTESNCSGNLIRSCWPGGDHYGNVQYIRIEVFIPAKVTSNSIKNLHSGFW